MELMASMACPGCSSRGLVPVVYGFPSRALVHAQRNGHVALGGDYLVPGDAVWICRGRCRTQWQTWPWGRTPPQVCATGNRFLQQQRLGLEDAAAAGGAAARDGEEDGGDVGAASAGWVPTTVAAAASAAGGGGYVSGGGGGGAGGATWWGDTTD